VALVSRRGCQCNLEHTRVTQPSKCRLKCQHQTAPVININIKSGAQISTQRTIPIHVQRFLAVAQLVEALYYKPEDRGIESFSRTMALVFTQPLAEMSTINLPGGKGRKVRKADNLTAICESTV
jgi:hypothetical protein